jgi:hypothetical protein
MTQRAVRGVAKTAYLHPFAGAGRAEPACDRGLRERVPATGVLILRLTSTKSYAATESADCENATSFAADHAGGVANRDNARTKRFMAGADLPFSARLTRIRCNHPPREDRPRFPPWATAKYNSQLRMLYYPQHSSPRARNGEDTGVITKYRSLFVGKGGDRTVCSSRAYGLVRLSSRFSFVGHLPA